MISDCSSHFSHQAGCDVGCAANSVTISVLAGRPQYLKSTPTVAGYGAQGSRNLYQRHRYRSHCAACTRHNVGTGNSLEQQHPDRYSMRRSSGWPLYAFIQLLLRHVWRRLQPRPNASLSDSKRREADMLRQPLIRGKRGQGLSINLIILAAIALIILVIISVLAIRSGKNIGQNTGEGSCLAAGGVCRQTTCQLHDEIPADINNVKLNCEPNEYCCKYDFTK